MARYVVKLPDLGEGTTEAEIVAWHVAPGQAIREEDPLVDVMTEKATVELPAPVAGTVVAINGKPGEKRPVGSELVVLEVAGEGNVAEAAGSIPDRSAQPLTPTLSPQAGRGSVIGTSPRVPSPRERGEGQGEGPAAAPQPARTPGAKPLASPAVRRRAWDRGVELRFVPGSGPGGRITQSDLDAYLAGERAPAASPAAARRDGVEDVPIIGLRRAIAEHLQQSKRHIPHYSYVEEIDVTALEELRGQLNATYREREHLTLLPFLMRAIATAVAAHPQVNARYDDESGILHRHRAVNIGVATQTEGGLLVPVVQHAEALDLWQGAAELRRLVEASRAGKATRAELGGSTITITSLGALGGIAATPVINYPEVAIVGVNRIAERPVVRDRQIVVRRMMNLSSSFDHRIVNGWEAASFIQRVKALLEQPALLFAGSNSPLLEDLDMPETLRPRVLVVGGGPGGYVAAIRAGQLGLDTVLVDAERPGGTCLLRGCIPSKALIHAADKFAGIAQGNALGIVVDQPARLDFARTVAWKDGIVNRLSNGVAGLLGRAKVRVVAGWARFSDAKSCTVETEAGPVAITAEHVILAAGSEAVALPALPFGGDVISSTEALSLPELPARLAVIGAGYIGLELGIAFRKLGAAVTIVEAADRILPRYDAALTRPVRRWLAGAGVELHLGAKVTGRDGDNRLAVETAAGPLALDADRILVTIGRRPLVAGWGLEEMALDREGPFVKVDDRCHTAMRNVWAIGDLVGEPMLAHKAMAQGAMVAEIIAGQRRHFDAGSVAAIVFSEPEIVVAGMLPDEAAAAGVEAATAIFPFAANGRALTLEAGADGGFVRVVARRDDQRILGIQAVGRQVAELAGEFAHALAMGAVLDDLAHTIHVHPTLGEAAGEAALLGLGHAIHL